MRKYLKPLLISMFFAQSLVACAGESKPSLVHATQGKNSVYYHIKFTFDHSNFSFSTDESGNSYSSFNKNTLNEAGGQFEVLVPVGKFPVQSNNCKKNIIIRMPWSDTRDAKQQKGIATKINLFEKLKKIKTKQQGEVTAVLELNPYVKQKSSAEHDVMLTGCNVFFRHKGGMYIDYLGQIKYQ